MKIEVKFSYTKTGPKAFIRPYTDEWEPTTTALRAYRKDMRNIKEATQFPEGVGYYAVIFQSNVPRAGCDSKTIQFKRILVTRRMYSFANYMLHILKHLLTYCIGTTLQPLIFGAKLPVILCWLKVRTTSITLL